MSVFRSYISCLRNAAFHFPLPKGSFYQERRNAGWMSLKAAIIPDFHLTARSYRANNSNDSSSRQKKVMTAPVDENELVSLNKPKPDSRKPRGRPAGSKNKPKSLKIMISESPNALQSHVLEVADGLDIQESFKNELVSLNKPKPGSRKSPGRPAGSKNKPKPLKILISDSPNALQSHILEVADGSDIQESLKNFASINQRELCILSGSGTVSNVTLKQLASPDVIVSLQGRFDILSLSGSILLREAPPVASGLTICLASGHGQVMGGCVGGPLTALGPAVIMAASFEKTVYEKLPFSDKVNSSSK